MNYTVSVNESKKIIEVVIEGKYKGVADYNKSDIQVGIELALERAKVAKANAEAKPKSVMELVNELEKALPKGQCVVVGNGVKPTKEMKEWLHSLTDCKGMTADEIKAIADNAYDEGYAEGYDEGYSDAYDEIEADEDDDDDCDCDEDCECECECHSAIGGVVVMSGSGDSIGGAMVRKMIEEYERKMRQ
jgi:hypothetical protein